MPVLPKHLMPNIMIIHMMFLHVAVVNSFLVPSISPKLPLLSTTPSSQSIYDCNAVSKNYMTTDKSSNEEEAAAAGTTTSFVEPEESKSNFGRMEYWNDKYKENTDFTWYSGWSDLQPFFDEIMEEEKVCSPSKSKYNAKILIPGIGNDSAMVDMYDAGYKYMTAFDYAPDGVEFAKTLFGENRIRGDDDGGDVGVNLDVADARNLPYDDDSFDAVLEKGTLDAVYLSGGSDKELAFQHLSMAVSELSRVVKKGGIVFSVTAACVDAIQDAFDVEIEKNGVWTQVKDGSLYITEDGYTSNNVDATMLVWKRL
uniref:Methyltransferase type 11 domain-containing protein n=1 Tax=Ditylum brightwellii TaxID=49249 RepID=A0A7S1ZUP8_9STRA|mmetsp:Transcript_38701/g.58110  ORF Transcript_38701/g.58110 Transcript_38701/m.58110 type:complete len:312 (+) Transcript_38701:199-1134(+)